MNGINSNEVTMVKGLSELQIISLAFLVISPFAIGFLLFSDFSNAVSTDHWIRNFGCICLLAMMGSSFALALYYLLPLYLQEYI
jgi:hypothetical protein